MRAGRRGARASPWRLRILTALHCGWLQLSHPHIIAYVGSFLERGSLHIVMEFASGGDLQCLIRRLAHAGAFLGEDRLWKFLIQLTQGLQHAHSRHILHRDIKASNIFLDASDNIKIGDFGLGKIMSCDKRCALSQVGTPIYMSPEMCEGKPYDTKSDVWALGCLLFELAALKPPFQAPNQALLARKIIKDAPDASVPGHYSREIPFIINKLLDKDPRRRPSPGSILNYSAVQIRLERARFEKREAELLARLDAAAREGVNKSVERASALPSALMPGQGMGGDALLHSVGGEKMHAEMQAERERLRAEKERMDRERDREREEWRQRELALMERCRELERERDRERAGKETALSQIEQMKQDLRPLGASPQAQDAESDAACTKATELEAPGNVSAETCAAVQENSKVEGLFSQGVARRPAYPDGCVEADKGRRLATPAECCGGADCGETGKGQAPVAIPTPSKLFVSPSPAKTTESPYPLYPDSVTPAKSVAAGEKAISQRLCRTPLTRRSWGEEDGLRPSGSFVSGYLATPRRGPLRGSVERMTPSASNGHGLAWSASVEQRESNHGRCGDGIPVRGWEGEGQTVEEGARLVRAQRVSMAEDAGAAPPDASTTPAGDEEGRHSERLALLEALAHMTPVRCSNHGDFGGGSGVQTDSAGAGGCRVVGGDGAAAMHTPSASVVKGYIRARRRTPQTSLGPAKRVPITDAARDSSTRAHASVRAGDVDSLRAEPPAVRCGDISGSPAVDRHSCPPVSASSPKHSCGGERDVADLWALTEGLRRSAQMALHASSSSGSGGSENRSPATPGCRSGEAPGPGGTSLQQSSPPVVPARRLSFVPVQ